MNPTNLASANHRAFAVIQITDFKPEDAIVKCSLELTTSISEFTIGDINGYTSLFDVASKSTPDANGQIQINITGFSIMLKNPQFVLGVQNMKYLKKY